MPKYACVKLPDRLACDTEQKRLYVAGVITRIINLGPVDKVPFLTVALDDTMYHLDALYAWWIVFDKTDPCLFHLHYKTQAQDMRVASLTDWVSWHFGASVVTKEIEHGS